MDIVIKFHMNMINYKETVIQIDNPYSFSERSRSKKVQKIKKYDMEIEPDEDEWYQLSNIDAYTLATTLISKMHFIKYSRSNLAKARIYRNVSVDYSYELSSLSMRIYKLFLKEYELISGGN